MSDKRLAEAQILFKEDKPDLGLSVVTKAEKYLENADNENKIARKEGNNTSEFLQKFMLASLKHREVLDKILAIAPEDAKPLVVKMEDYPKRFYDEAKNGLLEAGNIVPQNPFGQN
jgi:hypothetical protein